MKQMLAKCGVFCLASAVALTVAAADFRHGLSGIKPWTDEKFLDDSQEFHFAIIGDRTGGERGFCGDAPRKAQ